MEEQIQAPTSDENFAKFVKKAKKRLNKSIETKEEKKEEKQKISCEYTFLQSTKAEEEKEIIQKIKQLLKKDPDVQNPIGKILQDEKFSNLGDDQKQRYVLMVSKLFNETKLSN